MVLRSRFSLFTHSSSFLLASVCSVLLPVPTGQGVFVSLSVCLFVSLSVVCLSVRGLSRPLAAVGRRGCGVQSFRDRFSASAE